ncbi:triosephosphate isomerase-like isoform X7 [Eriocheir sinensis]|uniref:triosephosphate isomerase-like isoform X7 n=1 Tax=Eriocheir sinensis TaxID=95602 RepID=UPI0021C8E254|nr:triosephosphate isomerase-like isoform X7 [Eriocheir sinensis]
MFDGKKFFVIGNWKMNVDKARIDNIVKMMRAASLSPSTEAVVGCPSCYLSYARQQLPSNIGVAAQNCYKEARGNFSGEISPAMIQDCGCEWVILGHPERRTLFQESDEFIGQKVAHAMKAGLKVVACLCETKEDRAAGLTQEVLASQLESLAASISDWSRVVLAFEALWASNTGVLATPTQVQEAMAMIREWLRLHEGNSVADSTRLIYAGSVSSGNCEELARLKDVDGFLVGSAALKPDIVDIINSGGSHVSKLISYFSGEHHDEISV